MERAPTLLLALLFTFAIWFIVAHELLAGAGAFASGPRGGHGLAMAAHAYRRAMGIDAPLLLRPAQGRGEGGWTVGSRASWSALAGGGGLLGAGIEECLRAEAAAQPRR